MKKVLLFSMLTMSIISCDQKPAGSEAGKTDTSATAGPNKQERNKQIVMASMEGFSKHDPAVIMKDAANNCTDYGNGMKPAISNADTMRKMFTDMFMMFPDFKGENLTFVADGDWVWVSGDWSGTWKAGDWAGMKPNNKSFKVKDVDMFKLNDEGKIIEHHSVADWETLMGKQLM